MPPNREPFLFSALFIRKPYIQNMKRRINEAQLRDIVRESVKRVLKEGGDLCWTDEDGTRQTTATETWRGVPGTIFIWHGEWSDPEVWYDGEEINYWDLEDNAWEAYKYECEGEASEDEYENLPSSWFKNYLDNEYMPNAFGEGI